jgi:hypothetical protein
LFIKLSEGVAVRIEPGNSNIPPIPGRKSGRVNKGATPLSSSSESSESTVNAEVAPLIAGLEEFPDIRKELVEEVRQRLSRGEHLSRAAAEQTAEAILADLASFIGQ